MALFSKKKKIEDDDEDLETPEDSGIKITKETLDVNLKVSKMAAQIESLIELRNTYNERFQQISEQLGELRMMSSETNRSMQSIQATAAKATELIEQVKAEKILMELAKQEQRAEVLKAGMETTEGVIQRVMEELKQIRGQMSFYKGADQLLNLNKEIKDDLVKIKRTEGNINKRTEKVEALYIDFAKTNARIETAEKLMHDLDESSKIFKKEYDEKFNDSKNAVQKQFEGLVKELAQIKAMIDVKLDRKDFGKTVDTIDNNKKEVEVMFLGLKARVDKLKKIMNKIEF